MLYVLICLCLSLAGVAGLQFFYMAYLERLDNEHKKRIAVLERRVKTLNLRLAETESSLSAQNEMLEPAFLDGHHEDEVWADVLEER